MCLLSSHGTALCERSLNRRAKFRQAEPVRRKSREGVNGTTLDITHAIARYRKVLECRWISNVVLNKPLLAMTASKSKL